MTLSLGIYANEWWEKIKYKNDSAWLFEEMTQYLFFRISLAYS
jgi:hypothetical protein